MRWHSEVDWGIGRGGAIFWSHRIPWYGYYFAGHINSNKSPFPRSTLSLNSQCQTTVACPTSFKPLLTFLPFLPLPNTITVPVSCLTCHYTPCGSGNSFSSQYFCCSASWWGQVGFSSDTSFMQQLICTWICSHPSVWSHVLPQAEHKTWRKPILTSAATTGGLNWCEMIRITELGRQNISETKWLEESYQVHQKGRSDKGCCREDDYSKVRQEHFAFSGTEVSVMKETLTASTLYI